MFEALIISDEIFFSYYIKRYTISPAVLIPTPRFAHT